MVEQTYTRTGYAIKDMPGRKFGRLTPIEDVGRQRGAVVWRCLCDCGSMRDVTGASLRSGNTKSCGCLQKDGAAERCRDRERHGARRRGAAHLLYERWAGMIQRCTNPNHLRYADYGGRGITVCERWRDFANFLVDVGDCPSGMSLDRIDNDGNYEPGNCRWATPSEQRINQRRMAKSEGTL